MSVNAIGLAVGRKGSGKTTLIRQWAGRARRRLIMDFEGTWEPEARDTIVERAADLIDLAHAEHWGNPRVKFSAVYRERDLRRMRAAGPGLAFAVRNLTLVIDELAWSMDARKVPERLRWVPQFGRNRRINLLGTTREPQEIADLFFSQADAVWFFQLAPGNGLERIRRRFGVDVAARVESLGPFEHFEISPNGVRDLATVFGREGLALKR